MKLVSLALVSGALVAAAFVASANNGEVRFEGRVTNQTCTVEGGLIGKSSFTVVLPQVSAAQLEEVGDTAGRTRFPMQLRNCGSTMARAFFEGGGSLHPDGSLRPDNYGPVHFVLFDQDGNRISPGSELQYGGTAYAPDALMHYEVAYERVKDTALIAGDFSTTVRYSVAYD